MLTDNKGKVVTVANVTKEELRYYQDKAEADKRNRHSIVAFCLWCETEFKGRRDRIFCNPSCKAKYHKAAVQIALDKVLAELAQVKREKEELIKEISQLKKEKLC